MRGRTPAVVRALPVTGRRLAWGVTADELPLVATGSHLHAGPDQLAWAHVEKVHWESPVLTVTEASEIEGTGGSRSWTLTSDARLAETVRACVTSSIVWSDRRQVGSTGHVQLVGRRIPGRELLEWQTVWERAIDRADPQLADLVQSWVEELRATIG